ncbi:ABC transporter [Flavobacteriales bacterium 34_180_T64]|nr:ABC transporter [Flavobacteriales bacterium 34_180_T64]
MKLLSFEIGDLGKDRSGKEMTFKSLQSGFKVNFHKLSEKGIESMLEFQPFCFVGLNGSGKSNVLEALASIFNHLEMCVAKYRPENFEKHFRREICTPDAFILKYLIGKRDQDSYNPEVAFLVSIEKEIGKEPQMFVEASPTSFMITQELRKVSLISSVRSQEKAPGKEFLPDLVVGYSSGENEILSLPFIKNRLIHFDEYKEAVIEGYPFKEPETSLLYIDEEMSQAVLLTCLIFEDPETTLKPLKDELGIERIQSFRMNLNYQKLIYYIKSKKSNELITKDAAKREVSIFSQFEEEIDKLKNCASSWFIDDSEEIPVLSIDFFVDDNLKQAIRENYDNTSFKFFRVLQILYELNNNIVPNDTKEEVYKSEGFYTDWKLPTADPNSRVFHFLDYLIVKEINDEGNTKDLLLREFSDGEHQFIHTMGICLMLKDRRTLLLLDEPETHFNPEWRSKFINVLKNSIDAGGANNFLKDLVITTHSPFIISDCKRDFVKWFEKGKEPVDIGFQTYGASADYIIKRTTNKRYLNSVKSLDELHELIENGTLDEIEDKIDEFGTSAEKQFLYRRLEELRNQ